ncbi:aminotransferase class I/II-fold pyridoxal phosphate-dependent enzyme [Jatrophihabitans sp. YIM 134969]
MSALAVATGSINLGQGFPDTDGPRQLLEDAVAAIRSGEHNQYPPGPGIPELRRAVAAHQWHHYGLEVDPDTGTLVTAGATEAIASAVLGLTDPGDEVVMFEPYYDSYAATVTLAGCTRKVVTLRPQPAAAGAPTHWTFDPDELLAAVTPRTRLILLNTPHNPTGMVFNDAELEQVADVARSNDLVVVSDEVYEHLVFDGRHRPIATLDGMAERTLTIGSAGKTFSVTGWKIGWATGPAHLVTPTRGVKQFLTYVNGGPFQPAVAHALETTTDHDYAAVAADLAARRDLFCDGLPDVMRPQATYFATVDVHRSGVEHCRELPERAGVVAIPSSVFYDSDEGDSYVRFAFCKRPEVLQEARRRLGELVSTGGAA